MKSLSTICRAFYISVFFLCAASLAHSKTSLYKHLTDITEGSKYKSDLPGNRIFTDRIRKNQIIDFSFNLDLWFGGESVEFFAPALPIKGTYSYFWSTCETTASISALSDNPYSAIVTDNQTACTSTCEETIANATALAVECSSVNGLCGISGSASVVVSAGSGDYSYVWSNGETTSTIYGLSNGLYSVIVTDNETGCTATCEETITTTPAIVADCSSENGLCGGLGSASVSISGGSGDYYYEWSNGETTASISDLADGIYFVIVTDNVTACTATCEETISNTLTLVEDCFTENGICGGTGSGTLMENALVTSTIPEWNATCASRNVTIKLMKYDISGSQVISTFVETLNDDGSFTLTNECPAGTYDILYKIDGGLAVLSEDVTLVPGKNVISTKLVILGDINNDNRINLLDVSLLGIGFGSLTVDSDFTFLADLNCDGRINFMDVSIINNRFNLTGDKFEPVGTSAVPTE